MTHWQRDGPPRVVIATRRNGQFSPIGVVAELDGQPAMLPGGHRGATIRALHRAELGQGQGEGVGGALRISVTEHPDPDEVSEHAHELAREYRIVIEEILEARGASGIVAFLRTIEHPGALADTAGYSPDLSLERKIELLETLDVELRLERALSWARDTLAEIELRRQDPRRRRGGHGQVAARVRAASPARRHPQGAGRRGRSRRRRALPRAHRRDAALGRGSQGGRARAQAPRQHRPGPSRGLHHPHLPRLAAVPAMGQGVRGSGRRGRSGRSARGRPRRSGRGQGPHPRVPGGAQLPAQARDRGRGRRSHPLPRRASRRRQDVAGRVDRPCARTRVRAHEPRRHPRRGRDPRSPAHLHRRAAGPPRARPARRRHHEPGDPARRGRQARRRLARRSVVRAARGARPGAELDLPRPLPRPQGRSLQGALHRHGERRRADPRGTARPPRGHPHRRLHRGREGRHRAALPRAARRAPQRARGRARS